MWWLWSCFPSPNLISSSCFIMMHSIASNFPFWTSILCGLLIPSLLLRCHPLASSSTVLSSFCWSSTIPLCPICANFPFLRKASAQTEVWESKGEKQSIYQLSPVKRGDKDSQWYEVWAEVTQDVSCLVLNSQAAVCGHPMGSRNSACPGYSDSWGT